MAEKVGNIQNNLLWCDAGWLQVHAVFYHVQWQHKWKQLQTSLVETWIMHAVLGKKKPSLHILYPKFVFASYHDTHPTPRITLFPLFSVHSITLRPVWDSKCSYPISHTIFLLNEFVVIIIDQELLRLLFSSLPRSLDFWVQLISQLSYYCLVSAH